MALPAIAGALGDPAKAGSTRGSEPRSKSTRTGVARLDLAVSGAGQERAELGGR
ncbi:MAG: hypothetical protein M3N15_07755 [Actinomycetota bacterium]|nr:hypothetical protein [Actinomycetota bacterium]